MSKSSKLNPDDQPKSPNKSAASPKPRSPAQVETSRRNGARSRGPVTPEGKDHSSQNAVKHGLCSRKPWPEGSMQDRLYQEALAGLTRKYKPAGYAETFLVREAAKHMTSILIAEDSQRVFEHVMPSADPGANRPSPALVEQQLFTVEEARRRLECTGRMDIAPDDRAWLAEMIAGRLGVVESEGRATAGTGSGRTPEGTECVRLWCTLKPEGLGIRRREVEGPSPVGTSADGGRGNDLDAGTLPARHARYDATAVCSILESNPAMAEPQRGQWALVLKLVAGKLAFELEWLATRQAPPPGAGTSKLIRELTAIQTLHRYLTYHRRCLEKILDRLDRYKKRKAKCGSDDE